MAKLKETEVYLKPFFIMDQVPVRFSLGQKVKGVKPVSYICICYHNALYHTMDLLIVFLVTPNIQK